MDGHDLIRAGYKPGPIFAEMLSFAEDLQLESSEISKAALLDLVRQKYPVDTDDQGNRS